MFTKFGKLYLHVSYATLRIKVDIVPLKTENEALCSVVKKFNKKLEFFSWIARQKKNQGII